MANGTKYTSGGAASAAAETDAQEEGPREEESNFVSHVRFPLAFFFFFFAPFSFLD